jgi:recombination protein RecR
MVDYLERLINELGSLPGVGPKTAARLAYHLLRSPEEKVRALAEALMDMRTLSRRCSACGAVSSGDLCNVCSDTRRDPGIICVVEEAQNITPIERSAVYRGLYHVLDGVLDPLSGIGPEDLRIKELLQRLRDGTVREIIVATNPKVEGDATALYIAKLISPLGIRITRIARGIPVGSDLDFADEVTLGRAIEGRTEL